MSNIVDIPMRFARQGYVSCLIADLCVIDGAMHYKGLCAIRSMR